MTQDFLTNKLYPSFWERWLQNILSLYVTALTTFQLYEYLAFTKCRKVETWTSAGRVCFSNPFSIFPSIINSGFSMSRNQNSVSLWLCTTGRGHVWTDRHYWNQHIKTVAIADKKKEQQVCNYWRRLYNWGRIQSSEIDDVPFTQCKRKVTTEASLQWSLPTSLWHLLSLSGISLNYMVSIPKYFFTDQ